MNGPLDLESSFSENDAVKALHGTVRALVADSDFEEKWRKLLVAFRQWESGNIAQTTSRLNVQLEFLRRLQTTFPAVLLYQHPAIVERVLAGSGAKNVGDTFRGPQPDRRDGLLRVTRREITERFGILYTLETQEGFPFTREFFD